MASEVEGYYVGIRLVPRPVTLELRRGFKLIPAKKRFWTTKKRPRAASKYHFEILSKANIFLKSSFCLNYTFSLLTVLNSTLYSTAIRDTSIKCRDYVIIIGYLLETLFKLIA